MNIKPVEYKCVVLPLDIEEVDPVLARAKAAGLQLATKELDREQQAQVRAKLLAIGGNAFEDWDGTRPAVDDIVLIAKYAGLVFEDGEVTYRIINDKDIAAVLEE